MDTCHYQLALASVSMGIALNLASSKRVINSARIVLLLHGFVFIITCLLIACDTDIYAIILNSVKRLIGNVITYFQDSLKAF